MHTWKALLGVVQDATGKECGLHSGNVAESTEDAKAEATDLWIGTTVEALSKDQLAALKEGPRDKDTLVVLYAPWCQYSQVCSLYLPPHRSLVVWGICHCCPPFPRNSVQGASRM